ncbi:hypothetical protein [Streptomyces sp. TR06-5]|uniref:hypothetical protein n=1 Tax=Streptomyces sp. TR06-5 TaxID=3385976 RepID=UPI0039A24876
MSQLDALVDQWVGRLARTEPELGPCAAEIADRVRSDAAARMEAGADAETAVAAAAAALGTPREVADAYRRTARRREQRFAARWVGVTLGATLLATTAIVLVDKVVRPIDPAWAAFAWVLSLPALSLPVLVAVRSRSSAVAGAGGR